MVWIEPISASLRGTCRQGGFSPLFIFATGAVGICPGLLVFRWFSSTFVYGFHHIHLFVNVSCKAEDISFKVKHKNHYLLDLALGESMEQDLVELVLGGILRLFRPRELWEKVFEILESSGKSSQLEVSRLVHHVPHFPLLF